MAKQIKINWFGGMWEVSDPKKAISFTPASWELFGVRMKKHYSYNVITGKWDFTGWEIFPL